MEERSWFSVGTRLVGVGTLVYGIWDLVHPALFYAAYFQNPDMSFRFYMIAGWCSIGIGLLLIRAPGIIVNFAYGVEDEIESEGAEEEADSSKDHKED